MQIAAMRGGEEGMALGIVKEQQCPATQHLARAPHQAAGDQMVCGDGFLVSIQVEGGGWLTWLRLLLQPERAGPTCQCLREGLVAPSARHLGEKAFALEVAIRSSPSGQERQRLARVAPQVPRASQPHRAEEEQG